MALGTSVKSLTVAESRAVTAPAAHLPALAGPRGVMLNPVPGASIFSDRSLFAVRAQAARGIPFHVFKPLTGVKLGSPELEALLDRETCTVARPGNLVELLPDGQRAFAARSDIAAMALPGESLHQQTFVNRNDGVGWSNARLMMHHARHVGPARHMYDSVGSSEVLKSGSRIFERQMRAGVQVEQVGETALDWLRRNNRWHEKYFLLHNRIGILGGINLGSEYKGSLDGQALRFRQVGMQGLPFLKQPIMRTVEPWHDMDFMIRGPVVADMQGAFLRTWASRNRVIEPDLLRELTDPTLITPHVQGGCKVRFIQHRPWEDGDDFITAAWVRLIDATDGPIHIETPYFSPPPPVLDALKRAAGRGLPVIVLTSCPSTVDFKIAYHAGAALYRELLEAGVRIFLRSPMVHAKVMTLDGKVTVGGSANMNGRSRYRDSESVVVVESPELTKQVEDTVKNLLDSAREVTLESLADTPFGDRILQVAGRALQTSL